MGDRFWGDIPAGFMKVADEQRGRLVVRHDKERIITICLCRDVTVEERPSHLAGRAKLRSFSLRNGETALIRTYRHGGLLRHITGDRFFTWPPRPFRELGITEELRRRGIPTVEVYGACIELIWGPLYRGWLVTRELNNAQDLWSAFQSGFVQELGLERVLRAVAKSLRALHREGVYHRDLNLKNILVRAEGDEVKGYIIDFDKAKLFLGRLPKELANRHLNRLLRSVRKLDPGQKYLAATGWDRFIEIYQEGAAVAD
jgi:tRNA A-37 threonylcarbamoyl transferase component Bud32